MLPRIGARALKPSLATVEARRAISVQSLLHGSPDAKQQGDVQILQHSKAVARGKYVHGFEISCVTKVHRVKPSATEEYKKAAEAYYTGIKNDPELRVKLTGSWETVIGELDTFYHILEYENYDGWDKTTEKIRNSDQSQHTAAYNQMLPYLVSRSNQLAQEFSLFPTSPPRSLGGVFELRSYQLKAGSLMEWEETWRKGIDARRGVVEPVGAWFSQLGRLHQVYHLWQYPNLHTRKELREQSWKIDGWAETVYKVKDSHHLMFQGQFNLRQQSSHFTKYQDSLILEALPFSTLK
ncbi:hypothetical protein NLI96_g7562 [Meripilus lineatus]|uniref:NIPSNAP domain-containing protein n=1 Tax=Meripilus lineatus TaxID=2056292 RepID=A0AAD5UZ12_9APHY|nr:hypothetical protein NLI96_g7562 [Physisporinus lineatus]